MFVSDLSEYDKKLDEEEDLEDTKDWDRFDSVDRKFNSIPACGYLNDNGNVVTKHDISLNGQRNMKKLMSFPPHVQTGDGAASDFEISNKVYNR